MRRQVVEIECSRCKRVEHRPVTPRGPDTPKDVDWASGPDSTALTVALIVDGKPVVQFSFTDLCTPCIKAVGNHLEAIQKSIKGASPNRGAGPALARPPNSVVELGAKKKAQGHP
jgi:hypothetical protein